MNETGRETGRTRPADETGRDRTTSRNPAKQGIRDRTPKSGPETGRRRIPIRGCASGHPSGVEAEPLGALRQDNPEKTAGAVAVPTGPPGPAEAVGPSVHVGARVRPHVAGDARLHDPVPADLLERALAFLSMPRPQTDALVLLDAQTGGIAVHGRQAARAQLLVADRLDANQAHLTGFEAPPGFVWAVALTSTRTHCWLISVPRPAVAPAAAA